MLHCIMFICIMYFLNVCLMSQFLKTFLIVYVYEFVILYLS